MSTQKDSIISKIKINPLENQVAIDKSKNRPTKEFSLHQGMLNDGY